MFKMVSRKRVLKSADNSLFKMNIQLFAEGEPAAVPATASVEPAAMPADTNPAPAAMEPATTVEPSSNNELLDFILNNPAASRYGNTVQNTEPVTPAATIPGVQPAATPAQPATVVPQVAQSLDWVPEKFRANPENFAKSYTELERKLSEMGNTNKAVFQQLQNAGFQVVQGADGSPVVIPVNPQVQQGQVQGQGQSQAPEAAPEGLTEEQLAELNEKISDAMLDPSKNPAKLIMDLVAKVTEMQTSNLASKVNQFDQRIQAQVAQEHWQGTVKSFAENTADFEQYADEITKVIQENGQYLLSLPDDNARIKTAYDIAKANVFNANPPVAPKTLTDYLADPNSVAEIANNPEIQKLVLAATAQQMRTTNGTIPVTISGQPAGAPPSATPEVLTTSKDRISATKGLLSRFFGAGQT